MFLAIFSLISPFPIKANGARHYAGEFSQRKMCAGARKLVWDMTGKPKKESGE
jgi:hypothetical protein